MADAPDDARSERSGTSGGTGGMSETSSQRSDARALEKRHRARDADDDGDLLEQKRTLQDGIFACMYTLVRQSALGVWQFTVLKIMLEGLMAFRVIFNSIVPAWEINAKNPLWVVIRWTLWRAPIVAEYGYKTYIILLYVQAAAVLVAVLGLVWLTLAMRRTEQSKWLRHAAMALHVLFDVMFQMCYISFLDYFVFTANCAFGKKVKHHMFFTDVMCLEMPHVLHMIIGCFTAVVFIAITAFMVVASCDLNPISKAHLASPAAYTRLKILMAKAVYVIATGCLDSILKVEVSLSAICVAIVIWWNFRSMPFYRNTINVVWCGMWFGLLYTAIWFVVSIFQKDQSYDAKRKATLAVLYGIFPVIAGSSVLCEGYLWWMMRAAKRFKGLQPGTKVHKIYKFDDPHDVERLSRAMRKFDIDGEIEEEAAALGETIIKAGMQTFPKSPFLLILYANFLLEVRKDGPASRTQLQLASKLAPGLVERYQVFCTNEASKRLKDNHEGGLDLQAYIEFKRNYRAVLRVHKQVLALQNDTWRACMRNTVRVSDVDRSLDELEAATARANQVYKRVLERYPANGKLLRCYGKFLEDVKHDPVAAARAYGEANRNGGGEGLLALDLSAVHGEAEGSKPTFLTSMTMDDPIVVCSADGVILMASTATQSLFGYPKAELEGTNVSLLMPQPFSQRHNGYMARYVGGGEARLLDSVREVVGLHRERYVFPLNMCVTKLSGMGTDSVFLAVMRPLPPRPTSMRAWVTPNGMFLCGDQAFASLCGAVEAELVGRPLHSLATNPDQVEQFLLQCRDASVEDLAAGLVRGELQLRHRYLEDPIPVEVTSCLAGTDTQRILVLDFRRTDGEAGNVLVVDSHMRVKFAACGVAQLLGHSMAQMAAMRLDQLLPPPFNTMHAKWLKDQPAAMPSTSCRKGLVVHLVNAMGMQVPVRIKLSALATSDSAAMCHVVQVDKVAPSEEFEEKRLVLETDFSGRVKAVSAPDSELFDFPARNLVGASLCDFIDVFSEWQERTGDSQLQLLLLALLDKEHELPGMSWRVRLHAPPAAGSGASAVPHLPAVPGATAAGAHGHGATVKTACMQVEVEDDDDQPAAGAGGGTAGEAAASEDGDQASSAGRNLRIRVVLWRRDLLTGVLELDENMVIRKASASTGLICGLPATALLRKPMSKLLDMPHGKSWEQLTQACAHSTKKSALKGGPGRSSISPPMAFIGPHPDMGTMRIMVQGVQSVGPGGRPRVNVTWHPDTSYAGARTNIMRALKLDEAAHNAGRSIGSAAGDDVGRPLTSATMRADGGGAETAATPSAYGTAHQGLGTAGHKGASAARAAAGCEHEQEQKQQEGKGDGGAEPDPEEKANSKGDGESGAEEVGEDHCSASDRTSDSEGKQSKDDSDGASEAARLHRRSATKSEFVASWVRTLTKQVSGVGPSRQVSGVSLKKAGPRAAATVTGTDLLAIPEMDEGGDGEGKGGADAGGKLAARTRSQKSGMLALVGDEGGAQLGDGRALSKALSGQVEALVGGEDGGGGRKGKGKGGAGSDSDDGEDKQSDKGSDSEIGSEAGSQGASALSAATDTSGAADLVIDARRGRLLKALNKLLMGPVLMAPMERLRLHSYALLGIMLVLHIACYVAVTMIIKEEHANVYMVHRQAMAMDRGQLVLTRTMVAAFCNKTGIAPVTVCSDGMDVILGRLRTNLVVMEEFHQGVYLGFDKLTRPAIDVYNVWTQHAINYTFYLDTQPPRMLVLNTGVWSLGNRYIAAAREALYWLPRMGADFTRHRAYSFLLHNGIDSLYKGYAASLDLLVLAAWDSVEKLKTALLVLLVVEALFLQLLCTGYQWVLVQRVEAARLVGILAMLGLPGPVLRQLASKEAKIVEDSEDEDDAGSIVEEEQQQSRAPRPLDGSGGPDAAPEGAQGDAAARPSSPAAPVAAVVGGAGKLLLQVAGSDKVEQDSHILLSKATQGVGGGSGGMGRRRRSGGGGGSGSFRGTGTTRRGALTCGNGKVLLPSYWNVSKFVIPFFLWNAALVSIYAISLFKLQGMQGPLASLNMASKVTYRYTRIRAVAFGLVSAADAPTRAIWRDLLKTELVLFQSDYDTLLYGGKSISMVNSVFNHEVPAGTFESSDFAQEFFRSKGCVREDQSLCYAPSSPWYEVTHNGLDPMVRRMLSEMTLLSLDADEDVAYNGTRYSFMYYVGTRDLYEGLQAGAQLFVDYSISRYNAVTLLHTILLILTIACVLLFVLFVLWPHLARLKGDAGRQSALLSHVPPEMDVKGHVRAVFRKALAQTSKGKRAARAAARAAAAGKKDE